MPPDPARLAQAKKLVGQGLGEALLSNPDRPTAFVSAATFLDLANMALQLRDFYGVKTPNPPVTRVHCPLLAYIPVSSWVGRPCSYVSTPPHGT
jgi:hypothetical protein